MSRCSTRVSVTGRPSKATTMSPLCIPAAGRGRVLHHLDDHHAEPLAHAVALGRVSSISCSDRSRIRTPSHAQLRASTTGGAARRTQRQRRERADDGAHAPPPLSSFTSASMAAATRVDARVDVEHLEQALAQVGVGDHRGRHPVGDRSGRLAFGQRGVEHVGGPGQGLEQRAAARSEARERRRGVRRWARRRRAAAPRPSDRACRSARSLLEPHAALALEQDVVAARWPAAPS